MLGFKNRKILLNIVRLLCLFLWIGVKADDDDAHPITQLSDAYQQGIRFDEKVRIESGIHTEVVVAQQQHNEFEAVAKVKSIQPLLLLKERYQMVTAELKAAEARLKQAQLSHARHQELFRSGIAAKRSLQEQEASLTAELAQVELTQAKKHTIEQEARLNWGRSLADLVLLSDNDKFNGLLTGKQQLLQIILPTNKQLNHKIATIVVGVNGQRKSAISASLISRATQADLGVSGESYFFIVSDEKFRSGMTLTAWIADPAVESIGIVIPASSLLWYMDQVYVFVEEQKNMFKRRNIKALATIANGYLVTDGLSAGEKIVTAGGQMLLSEELRRQIPSEQD